MTFGRLRATSIVCTLRGSANGTPRPMNPPIAPAAPNGELASPSPASGAPVRAHLYLFYLGTTVWTLFFLGGLPSDYYQQWPWGWSLVVLVMIPTLGLARLAPRLHRDVLSTLSHASAYRLIAVYVTLPLALYDALYLGWHQQRGLSFLWTHWYLSVFYLIPWILLPPLAQRHAPDEHDP
jgi:hypothetical protein